MSGFGDTEPIETLRKEMADKFGVVVAYSAADITKLEQVATMVAQAERELGALEVVVNNAGVQFTTAIQDFPDAEWDKVIAI